MSLRKTVQEIVKEYLSREKIYSQVCTVDSVDETKRTCQLTPISGDAERKGRLQGSLELTEGVYIKPKVGSKVVLSFINNITGVITKFSEIDEFHVKISDIQLDIDDTEISFNGGANDGLVLVNPVLSAINRLETRIKSHQHISAAPGSPTVLDTATNPTFTNTVKADIENEEVKQ